MRKTPYSFLSLEKRCKGVEEIRAALTPWFALNPKLEMKEIYLVECGDLALSKSKWSLLRLLPKESLWRLRQIAALQFCGQADGGWLFAIDDPFGPQ